MLPSKGAHVNVFLKIRSQHRVPLGRTVKQLVRDGWAQPLMISPPFGCSTWPVM
jgi:hypothetical protein